MIFRIGLVLSFTFCSLFTIHELSKSHQNSNSVSTLVEREVNHSTKQKRFFDELNSQKQITIQSLNVAEGFAKHNNWLVSKTTLATVRRHLAIFSADSSSLEIDVIKDDLKVLNDLLEKLQLSPTLHTHVKRLNHNLDKLKDVHHKFLAQGNKVATLPEAKASETAPFALISITLMWSLFIVQIVRSKKVIMVEAQPEKQEETSLESAPQTVQDVSNLGEIVEDVIASMSPEIQVRGLSIEVTGSEELPISSDVATLAAPLESLFKLVFNVIAAQPKLHKKIAVVMNKGSENQTMSFQLAGYAINEEILSLKLHSGKTLENRLIELESELGLRAGSIQIRNHYTHDGTPLFASLELSFPRKKGPSLNTKSDFKEASV